LNVSLRTLLRTLVHDPTWATDPRGAKTVKHFVGKITFPLTIP
jgi:hypothetical protein